MSEQPRRPESPDEEPGCAPWMTTFGDMISLLLTFFVLLVSMASKEDLEYNKFAGALSGALSIYSAGSLSVFRETLAEWRKAKPPVGLRTSTAEKKIPIVARAQDNYVVLSSETTVYVTPGADSEVAQVAVWFERGSAEIRPAYRAHLASVVDLFRDVPYRLEVRGHADDSPQGTPEDNWRLSAARARSVIEYLARGGIAVDRMVLVACGDAHPVRLRGSDGRRMNRGVSIVVLEYDGERT
jgi:chemotaxis protein MotB